MWHRKSKKIFLTYSERLNRTTDKLYLIQERGRYVKAYSYKNIRSTSYSQG